MIEAVEDGDTNKMLDAYDPEKRSLDPIGQASIFLFQGFLSGPAGKITFKDLSLSKGRRQDDFAEVRVTGKVRVAFSEDALDAVMLTRKVNGEWYVTDEESAPWASADKTATVVAQDAATAAEFCARRARQSDAKYELVLDDTPQFEQTSWTFYVCPPLREKQVFKVFRGGKVGNVCADEQFPLASVELEPGTTEHVWRTNDPAVKFCARLFDPTQTNTALNEIVVDMGDPASEARFSLAGWGSVQRSDASSLRGDTTLRFMQLRSNNDVVVSVPSAGEAYVLTAEVQSGCCTDDFDLYINNEGPLLSYRNANLGSRENVVNVHRVELKPGLIVDGANTIRFVNRSTDNFGLAGVYNVVLAVR